MRPIYLLPCALVAACSSSSDSTPETPHPSAEAGIDAADASIDHNSADAADAKEASSKVDGEAGPKPDTGAPDAPPVSTFKYFSINHALCTGQSLSVGAAGSPVLSDKQPYKNKMFNTGVLAGASNLVYLVPLVEANVETMSSGMANLITELAQTEVFTKLPAPQNTHDVLVSCHGIGGTPYSGLKKGTNAFAAGMAQVKAAKEISDFYGLSYQVRVVTNVHGEADHKGGNTKYATDLATWQSDYETDVKATTKQTEPVPMLHTQMSSWTKYGQATSIIPQAQLDASVDSSGKILMVGPKYFLEYSADGVHLSNVGYRHMGEYYAKVYRRAILEGKDWEPLRPSKATLSGTEITITFQVPAPPLALDTTLVTDPGNNGFEYADDSAAAPAIVSVTLDGATAVKIKLKAAPTGSKKFIRYAWTGTPGALAGPTTGARGNLRDSDKTESLNGDKLYNWAVHFEMAVH